MSRFLLAVCVPAHASCVFAFVSAKALAFETKEINVLTRKHSIFSHNERKQVRINPQ